MFYLCFKIVWIFNVIVSIIHIIFVLFTRIEIPRLPFCHAILIFYLHGAVINHGLSFLINCLSLFGYFNHKTNGCFLFFLLFRWWLIFLLYFGSWCFYNNASVLEFLILVLLVEIVSPWLWNWFWMDNVGGLGSFHLLLLSHFLKWTPWLFFLLILVFILCISKNLLFLLEWTEMLILSIFFIKNLLVLFFS